MDAILMLLLFQAAQPGAISCWRAPTLVNAKVVRAVNFVGGTATTLYEVQIVPDQEIPVGETTRKFRRHLTIEFYGPPSSHPILKIDQSIALWDFHYSVEEMQFNEEIPVGARASTSKLRTVRIKEDRTEIVPGFAPRTKPPRQQFIDPPMLPCVMHPC